jgi:hypothetical protein
MLMAKHLHRLLLLIIILEVVWFALTITGLILGGFSGRLGAIAPWLYFLVIILALFILIARTALDRDEKRLRPPLPSAGGLAAGAVIHLLGAMLLGVVLIKERMEAPGESTPLQTFTTLLWIVGVGLGLLAALLLISGWYIRRYRNRLAEIEDRRERQPVSDGVWLRPDPWLYSQKWARSVGAGVTWDNPSIAIFDVDMLVEVCAYHLTPNSLYRLLIEVQNGTEETPAPVSACGTKMTIQLRAWGIGGPVLHWIIPTSAPLVVDDIPRTPINPGDPPSMVVIQHDWTSPPEARHYCMVVLLEHPDDANPFNNEGQQNMQVIEATAGETAQFTIPIWNRIEEIPFAATTLGKTTLGRALQRVTRTIAAPFFAVWQLLSRLMLARSGNQFGRDSTRGKPDRIPSRIKLSVTETLSPRSDGVVFHWPHRISEEELDLPVIPAGDTKTPAKETVLSVEVPAGATPGELASFTVTADRPDGMIGGVTCIVKVVEHVR